MIFECSDLLKNRSKKEELDLFHYGLELAVEADEEIRNIYRRAFSPIFHEDFSDIIAGTFGTIGDILNAILEKFKEIIETIWNKVQSMFVVVFGHDKTIKKYLDDLKVYYEDDNKIYTVKHSYYPFRNLEEDIPESDFDRTFLKEFDELESLLKDIGKKKLTKAETIMALDTLYREISDPNDIMNYMNRMYSTAMRTNNLITQDNYITRLKDLYGYTELAAGELHNTDVFGMIRRVERGIGQKLLKDNKRYKKEVQASASRIQKNIRHLKGSDILKDYIPIDYDIESALNKVLEIRAVELNKVCNEIYVPGFSLKIQILKDAIAQDRTLLSEIISDMLNNK